MEIKLAKLSGFCFGVKNAVDTAYDVVKQKDKKLYMLGQITHNEIVVNELLSKGFILIDDPNEAEDGSTVLLRAHGVTRNVKEILASKNCNVIDCTCPFVEKIHKIVREQAEAGKNIIVTGAKGHPEVVGICSEAAPDRVFVVSKEEELKDVPFPLESAVIVSQTTFSVSEYNKICASVKNQIAKSYVFDTICITTESRQREAVGLATECDVMLVIGSAGSSNTSKLFDICRSQCDRTYLVADRSQVRELMAIGLIGADDKVGVTAGASTPQSIILEVVDEMSENEVTNQEQTDINFGDYIDSIPQLRRGAIVKGAVTSADADYVYVDVRDKSEGKIPRKEVDSDPEFDLEKAIAERLEVSAVVKSIRNSDMGKEIILSKSQVDIEKHKKAIEDAFANKTPVTLKITNVVKDGVIGSYAGGIDVYVHKTQIKNGDAGDLEQYKGQTIDVLITKLDTDSKHRLRISGSHRAILTNERKEKADALWNDIEIGKHYKGIVRSLPAFGAFVDIGGVDGLVHITELSWNRISKPSDVLSIGDEVDVFVKDFNKETKKISLGYKKEEDDPYYNIEERIPVGSIVKGKVVRLTNFGAFVELEPNLDALCHVSEISSVRLQLPSDALSVGMEVEAKVIDVKKDQRRISISIKEVAPIDPVSEDEDIYAISEEAPAAEASEEA